MTSTNQTSLILLSLDKALIDNADKLARKPGHDRALTLAVFKTIMGAPLPAEATNGNHDKQEVRNANTVSNSR